MSQIDRFSFVAPVYNRLHIGARRTASRIKELAVLRETDHLLDLGGVAGRIASLVARDVSRTVVADVSSGMIEQCGKNSSLECILLEGNTLPFADSSFDKVIMIDAFHHMMEMQGTMLKETHRVLKNGGEVVLLEVDPSTFPGKFAAWFERVTGLTHIFHEPADLKQMWELHGFTCNIHEAALGQYYLVASKE